MSKHPVHAGDVALTSAVKAIQTRKGSRRGSWETHVSPQAILFTAAAWGANCPQHLPQRFEAAEVASLAERGARIGALEAEVERLRGRLPPET